MQNNLSLEQYRELGWSGPKGPCPPSWTWDRLMGLAFEQAEAAAAEGDIPVGAVLVDKSGRILARAGNRVERDSDPSAHAEILALRIAAKLLGPRNLTDCILIATLEPCLMCAGAIALSRVAGVVFGAADARAGSLVSAADADCLPLAGRSFWRLGGIRSGDSVKLLQDFFSKKRTLAIS